MISRNTALLCVLLFSPSASAQEKCKEAYQAGYEAGKDIAELKREVRELRGLIGQLMAAMGGKELPITKLPPPSTESPPPTVTKGPTKGNTGTVGGKVDFLPGQKIAFVYVENVRGRMARGKKAKIEQKNKQFSPRWMVVQKGTVVEFPNRDNIYHNVFSSSPLASFDLGIYRSGDKAKSFTFTKPGVLQIFCNMHEKMTADVLVVPNYLYTRVSSDGSFTLKRVPKGKRKLVAWAPGAKLSTGWIDVRPGGKNKLTLKLERAPKRSHKNKNGQPYGSYP